MVAPLSEEDVAAARVELAAGRPVAVWFTPAAVGVPAHGSAKVVSVGDVADGDFIEVRPAGSRDTMFCAPNELTRTRPPRKRVQKPEPPADEAVPVPAPRPAPVPIPAATAAAPTSTSAAPSTADTPKRATRSRTDPPPDPAPQPTRTAGTAGQPTGDAAPPPAADGEADRRRPTRPTGPGGLTVTLTASAEGEWTVDVLIGKRRAVRPTPVQPADVAKAARALPPAVAEAIDASLEAARQRQLDRVERLKAELEAAQRALQELNG